ncbi:25873_t:CDS:2, partial [Racocetra persica]
QEKDQLNSGDQQNNKQQSQDEPQDLEALEGSQEMQCNNEYHTKLIQDFSNLLTQKIHWDIKINVTTRIFEAHSTVLRARSSFFREILCSNRVQCEILIPDISPKAFKTLLNYMYCGSISLDNIQPLEIFELHFAAIKLNLREVIDYLNSSITFTR